MPNGYRPVRRSIPVHSLADVAPYIWEDGEECTFYLLNPDKTGMPSQPGTVVHDGGGLTVTVRDEAGAEHVIASGHLWKRTPVKVLSRV